MRLGEICQQLMDTGDVTEPFRDLGRIRRAPWIALPVRVQAYLSGLGEPDRGTPGVMVTRRDPGGGYALVQLYLVDPADELLFLCWSPSVDDLLATDWERA